MNSPEEIIKSLEKEIDNLSKSVSRNTKKTYTALEVLALLYAIRDGE
ncbi:MAG: hypothetical protein NC305_04040 [Lachnospiraceae bacterium]|nr:hypothetical protein [Lachnospiraceae bacterium]